MKASEMIYRLARAIEAKGDKEVMLTVVRADSIFSKDVEAQASCMDVYDDYFELYGEEK